MTRFLCSLLLLLATVIPASAGVIFDSPSDYLSAAPFTMPTTGTLCLYVKPTWVQTDGADHYYIDIRNLGSTNAFLIFKAADNTLDAGWVTGGVGYAVSVSSGSYTQTQSVWNSLCVTWDDTANEVKLYLNGSQIGSTIVTLVTWDTSAETFNIGNLRSDVSTRNLAADIAEVAIWNRVLSTTDVTNYNNGIIASASCLSNGLAFYWPLPNTADITDHADSKNLTNTNVNDSADHPTVSTPCGGACIFGSGIITANCGG